MVRKWYKKLANADRRQESFTTKAGSEGNCHFCDGCNKSHKMLGSLSAARGGMVW